MALLLTRTKTTSTYPKNQENVEQDTPERGTGSREQEKRFEAAQEEGYKAMLVSYKGSVPFEDSEKVELKNKLMIPFYDYYLQKGTDYQLMIIKKNTGSDGKYHIYVSAGGNKMMEFDYGYKNPLETWTP